MVDPLAGEIWMLCRNHAKSMSGPVLRLGDGEETLVFFTSRHRAVKFLHHLPGTGLRATRLEREYFLSIVRTSFSPEIATHICWDPEVDGTKLSRAQARMLPIFQFLCNAEDDGDFEVDRSITFVARKANC